MKDKKRLIYLEDAISLLEKDIAENKETLQLAYHGDKEAIRGEINGVRRAIHILKHHASHEGTVDAVELVHGRWVDKMVRDWHCSVCGKKVPRQVYFDGYCYDDKLNYCPNCGAKMDGGVSDD